MKQIRIRLGYAQEPAGGAYSAPPDPIAGLRGPTSKGKEGRKGPEGGGKGERDGKERGSLARPLA